LAAPGAGLCLQGGMAALLDARIVVQGSPRWGQGPFAKTTFYQKTIKNQEICTISFCACRVMPKWCWATLLDAQILLEVLLQAQKQSWGPWK